MKRPYSRESLVEFINEYSAGILQRSLRSESSKRFAKDFKSLRGCDDVKETEICVRELNAETFLDVVMDPRMVRMFSFVKKKTFIPVFQVFHSTWKSSRVF